MDRRSWPWKKKSSDKAVSASEAALASIAASQSVQKQDRYKKPKYVQISVEQYTNLTRLEEQIKEYEEQANTYEEQIKTYEEHVQTYEEQVQTYEDQTQNLKDQIEDLNEKLSEAQSEITTKENKVKQHSKVAEDAVSGWEKAEAEALALKTTLESVTLSKLAAEDRAARLDGGIKECMRQIRTLKEEHEHTLQDIVLTKTKQMDKLKLDFERKMSEFEQELLRSASDNDTLSRTLQERSNMLVQISEEKSRAEAEIERLKYNIESDQREINSLKYELHVASKEVEIRNEEKNMSVRSAESANKQNIESMKKVAKLEAECQRLRGLVRKKLPGPAAIAQMRLEVESLGKDYGETRPKRSPVKSSSPRMSPNGHSSPVSDFAHDNALKFQKEIDFLTERLLAMEEEMKMLKEALAKRNSELQESRNLCAQTTSRLHCLESQLQRKITQKSSPEIYSSQNASNPPSSTSISEDGNDDSASFAESPTISTPSHAKKVTEASNLNKEESVVEDLELMHDFLEMEKLAGLPKDSNTCGDSDVIEPSCDEKKDIMSEELATAISRIHEFVLLLGNVEMGEDDTSSEEKGFQNRMNEFSVAFNKVLSYETNLPDFLSDLSHVLTQAGEMRINGVGFKNTEKEIPSLDCIDKIALPESKVIQKDSSEEIYQNGHAEVPADENAVSGIDLRTGSSNFTQKEFEELKLEKEEMGMNLEVVNSRLNETEQLLADVKSQLTSAQMSKGFAETQLKCMTESYRLLETRATELESEVERLRERLSALENELEDEKLNHEDALAKCKQLEEQLVGYEETSSAAAKTNQENELEAAAEKLAECQETIFLLGKQLNSFRPRQDQSGSSPRSEKSQKSESFSDDEADSNCHGSNQTETDDARSANEINKYPGSPKSPSHTETNQLTRSPVGSKNEHSSHARSGSSSSSSNTSTPEKPSRGISRFFSAK